VDASASAQMPKAASLSFYREVRGAVDDYLHAPSPL